MHKTPAQQKIKDLLTAAEKYEREAAHLDQVEGMEPEAQIRRQEAARLREQAEELRCSARLEDLNVYKTSVSKKLASGKTKEYLVWRCSWRNGAQVVNKHLGSCSKMSHNQAMEKARKLKAEALGLLYFQ